jgi:hypothetical protein
MTTVKKETPISVKELIIENNSLMQMLLELEKEKYDIENKIKLNSKCLWLSCKHEWVDQQDSSMYEKSSYRCSKCKLIKDCRLYTY